MTLMQRWLQLREAARGLMAESDALAERLRGPRGEWVPINDFPGDQRYDHIRGNALASFWGEIGREHPTGWSWTIIATNDAADSWEPASGRVDTEAEAKAAVEAWTPTEADSRPQVGSQP